MRDIKFRRWDKHNDQFIMLGTNHDLEFWFGGAKMFPEKQLSKDHLEQYTGLKDKNGEEIYEGDILSSFVDPEIILKHVVEWSEKYSGWYLWNVKDIARVGDGSVQAFVYFNNTGKNCEISGNIHENPQYI